MDKITIYHNGQCTKSGGALELLIANNIPHQVRFYMAEPLTEQELKTLLKKLNVPAEELVRKYEDLYIQQYSNNNFSEEQWFELLLNHPELMQRPIIEQADKAFIARPPEKILDVIR